MRGAYADWFERRVRRRLQVTPDGCWLWTGSKDQNGYGMVRVPDIGVRRVHRIAYEHLVGPIPDGLQTDHLCRVRACANPAHLEPVTPRVNTHRGETLAARHAALTHCPRGHAYTPDNLIPSDVARGGRGCLTCSKEKTRLIGDAARALGLEWREYVAEYGYSRAAAEAVLASKEHAA
jgi:hypothetical protein